MTTSDKPHSALYAAATEALVSETSATSTFEKMIAVAYSHATNETFSEEVKEIEKIIRKEFEITSMPGPWRSAKSVITSAMKQRIELCDKNGSFYGKTYLQNKLKSLKEKKEQTIETYVARICSLLTNIPEELDEKTVRKNVQEFLVTLL